MRVVLDTNVFVSGIFWKGSSNKILNLWKDGKFEIVSSAETISEIVKVLRDFKIRLPDKIIKGIVELIAINSSIVDLEGCLNLVKDDPKDNMFIEAALEGNAYFIVSQDKHLLKIREFKGIKIVTPDEFISLF